MVVAAARDLLIPDSTRRVAAVLLRVTAHGEVAAGHPDGYAISQSDLGEMASISRYPVNRILADLQNRGWVTLGYSRIALRNVRALRGFAYSED
jgi:CRP-like cAMP-binding protein